jgi:uncharacterized protein (UPF0548 family)
VRERERRGEERTEKKKAAIMSWQSYVDDHLMCHVSGGNTLTAAAIVGQDGLVWAQSAGFSFSLPVLRFSKIRSFVLVEN